MTNREFSRALGKALRRPAFFPIPGLAIKALFGEMGAATALSSARVSAELLLKTGYKFVRPRLNEALTSLLTK